MATTYRNGEPRRKTAEEIALAYKSDPWWYDVRGFFILTFAYNSTLAAQLRLFGANMGPNHLEVACGTGTLLELVLRWRRWKRLPVVRITGVDYAESMLAGAMRRFRSRPGLHFELADAAQLPLVSDSFDTVNIANAVHCLPDVRGALREAFRVLRPGGSLAANVLLHPRGRWPWGGLARWINDWGIRKGILVAPYDVDEVRRYLVAAGFEVERETITGNCYNVIVRKPL